MDNPQSQLSTDDILSAAVDRKPSELGPITGDRILQVESSKPSQTLFDASLKASSIDSDSITNALKGEVLASQAGSTYSTTNNSYINNVYNSNSAVNSSSVLNAESINNLTNQLSEDVANLVRNESAVLNSNAAVRNEFNLLNNQVNSSNSNFSNSINGLAPMLERVISTVVSQGERASLDQISRTETNSTNLINKVDQVVNESQNSQLNLSEAVNRLFTGESKTSQTNSTVNEDEVFVKSKQLIESSTVNRLIQPDNSIERSVTQLTQTLPNAINNLSTIMSSAASTNSSSQSIVNEGTRLDQSTNTIINQNQQSQPQNQLTPETPAAAEQPGQMNEFYLQAIYMALMSGKVKVKLEYS